jgi:hypothetical protein
MPRVSLGVVASLHVGILRSRILSCPEGDPITDSEPRAVPPAELVRSGKSRLGSEGKWLRSAPEDGCWLRSARWLRWARMASFGAGPDFTTSCRPLGSVPVPLHSLAPPRCLRRPGCQAGGWLRSGKGVPCKSGGWLRSGKATRCQTGGRLRSAPALLLPNWRLASFGAGRGDGSALVCGVPYRHILPSTPIFGFVRRNRGST